ncbi:MAG: hypothetical protein ACRC1D_03505 [Culicoidibacterales bacterium]
MHKLFKHLIFTFCLALISGNAICQDFNYEFFPNTNYGKIETRVYLDTIKNEVKTKTDTSTATMSVVVRKLDKTLTVTKIGNVSDVVYQSEVGFAGFDQSGNFTYKTKNGESVTVNPMRSIIEITFNQCFDEPQPGSTDVVKKRCNTTRHIMGGPSLKISPPKK